MVVLGIAGRARPPVQALLCLLTAAATVVTLPQRLWRPQLRRLFLLSLFIFVMVVLGSGSHPAPDSCSLTGMMLAYCLVL